ncbi:MAG: hypothetical protein AB8B64_26840 [Granulosicoccus sp.]
MVETATLPAGEVLPHRPVCQWVLSYLYQLRFVLANHPQLMGRYWVLLAGQSQLTYAARFDQMTGLPVLQAHTGAVTLVLSKHNPTS